MDGEDITELLLFGILPILAITTFAFQRFSAGDMTRGWFAVVAGFVWTVVITAVWVKGKKG